MPDYGASCYNSTGSKCSGRAQPGTVALRDGVRQVFKGIGDLGIYNCRPTRGGGSLSTHGEGRGWDAACNANSQAGLAMGNRLAITLTEKYNLLGIQRIIWNKRQWDVQAKRWRPYGGVSPHTDHLHIELCWAAARDKPLTKTYVVEVLLGEQEDDVDEATFKKWLSEWATAEFKKEKWGVFKPVYLRFETTDGPDGIQQILNAVKPGG